jgi:hypothetical protein
LAGRESEPGRDLGRELRSDAAGDRDRVDDSGAVGWVELVDQLVVAADQRADGGDLLLAEGRVALRPVGERWDGAGEPFAVEQQLMQVVAQLRLA